MLITNFNNMKYSQEKIDSLLDNFENTRVKKDEPVKKDDTELAIERMSEEIELDIFAWLSKKYELLQREPYGLTLVVMPAKIFEKVRDRGFNKPRIEINQHVYLHLFPRAIEHAIQKFQGTTRKVCLLHVHKSGHSSYLDEYVLGVT